MAFLMLLHEKMRLQRKVNKLTLRQAQASSRKERVTKQIERIQKMYSKREANLDAQAKRLQNQASSYFRSCFGLASNLINTDYTAYVNGGMNNMGVMQTLAQAVQSGQVKFQNFENKEDFQEFLTHNYRKVTQDGQEVWIDANEKVEKGGTYTPVNVDSIEAKMNEANQLKSMAANQYQMNQSYFSNTVENYQSNISIWVQAQKEQIEMQQDEALAPLQEQEIEWDLESTSAETQLADARARLDSIKQALSEGIKDSAPTFGLG